MCLDWVPHCTPGLSAFQLTHPLPFSSPTLCLSAHPLSALCLGVPDKQWETCGDLMGPLSLSLAFLPFSSTTLCLLSAGLRQAMGTFGALMGSLIAGLAYTLSGRNYAVTFSLSALPALGALLLVTTVGHMPNCARLQPTVCSIATDCLLVTTVGHLPNCIRLHERKEKERLRLLASV